MGKVKGPTAWLRGPVEHRSSHEFAPDAPGGGQVGADGCGQCATLCQFGAIRENETGFVVDPIRCEGCKVCVAFCPSPSDAIRFPERHCGQWYVSATSFGPLVHAQLFPGAENSGRLVMVLKQQAKARAMVQGLVVTELPETVFSRELGEAYSRIEALAGLSR